jgi:hypothetical protein
VISKSVEQEIHALEDQRDHALLRADSDVLADLLGDGLVSTYWSGRSDGKPNYLEGVRSGGFLYRKIERPDERASARPCWIASPIPRTPSKPDPSRTTSAAATRPTRGFCRV